MGTQPTQAIIMGAQSARKAYPIPASVSIAQYADETQWGLHVPAGSNNLFGMKALPGQPYVSASTWEVFHGHRVSVIANFRTFTSVTEAFISHAKLLATAGVYAHARTFLPDAIAFCHALTGVYATDPSYGDKLEAIIRGSNLLRYDVA